MARCPDSKMDSIGLQQRGANFHANQAMAQNTTRKLVGQELQIDKLVDINIGRQSQNHDGHEDTQGPAGCTPGFS